MTPEKVGRAVSAVRIDWQWKTIDEARETEEENNRVNMARRKPAEPREAPPLTDEQRHKKLRDEHFKVWLEKNPGSSFVDFMRSPEYRQLRAEPA